LLSASTTQGLFYALMTFKQILRQQPLELPALEILDEPDFAQRGILLDVSRNKVPELKTLFLIVEQFAEWKINQIQLYTEHTFAYPQHAQVSESASPYTGEDMLRLGDFCRERHMELVPNQNSFGHLHRWLRLPEYQHLAECPAGFSWPNGKYHPEPFSLNPRHAETFPFLENLFDELLPHFESSLFNVGCDETVDLGLGASKEICEAEGKGRVYLSFLQELQKRVHARGRTMMCWSDIVMQHPALIPELPEKFIALEWGYEAGHPFAENTQRLRDAGIPFYVCPGTSAWRSLTGRTDNMLQNIREAAEAGKANGAEGLLLTDWGDCGHWQTLPMSYAGWMTGASLAWNVAAPSEEKLALALDLHGLCDTKHLVGDWIVEFGRLEQVLQRPYLNNTIFFQWLFQHPEHSAFQDLDRAMLEDLLDVLEDQRTTLNRVSCTVTGGDWVCAELHCMVDFVEHAIRRALCCSEGLWCDALDRRSLASSMQGLLAQFRHLWCHRNRIGGLQESTELLELRLREYRTGEINRDYVRFF
jgi:hypothetical protein